MSGRLLVCGSRTWRDARRLRREMVLLDPDVVIHGACPTGADDMADLWAGVAGRDVERHYAEWEKHRPPPKSRAKNPAGPIRNERMLREGKPDRGLAFGALWKPAARVIVRGVPFKKTGTGGMVALMLAAGLPVRWVATHDAVAVDLTEMPEAGR